MRCGPVRAANITSTSIRATTSAVSRTALTPARLPVMGCTVDRRGSADGHDGITVAPPDETKGQYAGWEGSTWLTQATTPPPTWTASEKPAPFTIASVSAD